MTKQKMLSSYSLELVVDAPLEDCLYGLHSLNDKRPRTLKGQLTLTVHKVSPDAYKFEMRFINKFPMVLRGRIYSDENFGTTVIAGAVRPVFDPIVIVMMLGLAGLGIYGVIQWLPCSLGVAALILIIGWLVFRRDYAIYREDARAIIAMVTEQMTMSAVIHQIHQTALK